jgi:cell division septal protein FtsQ
MANYRHGATYGSLAYDLDALAREKQLDEAGKLPQKKVRPAQPEVQPVQRRQTAARAAVRPSPVLLLGTVLVVGMVIALMLCYVKLTGISDNVSSIKREISALEEEHVALLTAYERTFDLATVKAAAEAAGMSKPSSGQIQYIDLSGADSVEVYAAGGAAALNGFTEKAESLWAYVLEYFR